MQSKKDNALNELRNILLAEDKQKIAILEQSLSQLQKQVDDKEALINSLQPEIAAMLAQKIHDSKSEMADALAPVMGEAIRRQISEAKDDVVDALYPVIGKAIRKLVAEAMKNLVDSVNKKIDQTFRSRLFVKKVQSKITGVSEGELLLKDALPFQVEELFLIHRETGLLISHVTSSSAETTIDRDLVSGMLTAIQDFVTEAFNSKNQGELDEIQYGDAKIILEMGRHSYLAAVVSGIESENFRENLRTLIQRIHNRYFKAIRTFNGDPTQFSRLAPTLRKFMAANAGQPDSRITAKPRPYLIYLMVILVTALVAYFAVSSIPPYIADKKLERRLVTSIESVPELSREQIDVDVNANWITLSGDVQLPSHKILLDSLVRQFQANSGSLSVVNQVRVAPTAQTDVEIRRQIRQKLSESVKLRHLNPRFIIYGDEVIIEGNAPDLAMKREVGFLVSAVPGIRTVVNNMVISKIDDGIAESAGDFIRRQVFRFGVNEIELSESFFPKLDSIRVAFDKLPGVQLLVKGYSDDEAQEAYNLMISEKRARNVGQYLISAGISEQNLVIEFYGEGYPIATNETADGRAKNRRVEFEIIPMR
ncbi:OmpA family protein [candidate division KSB1 bacterium]|nr:OmpA family protein [candidate division KSB1 bacterium]